MPICAWAPTIEPRPPATHFRFPNDDGSLANATLRCVGVGACRKEEGGTMCPSYMATREEKHSTRGRAHLLWEMLQGEVLEDGWQNEEVKEALDLCLSCKACKTECPTNVDIATYKAEFLSHYYEGRSRPLHAYAFGLIDRWARLASHTPRLANALGRFPLTAGHREEPAAHRTRSADSRSSRRRRSVSARSRDRSRTELRAERKPERMCYCGPTPSPTISSPQIAEAALSTCSRTPGSRVKVLQRHVCCGRPLYDFGMLDKAKQYLTEAMDALAEEISAGTPIVVLEPSCASVFRDEAVNLMPDDPRTAKLKRQTMLLSEFLVQHAPDYAPGDRNSRRFWCTCIAIIAPSST